MTAGVWPPRVRPWLGKSSLIVFLLLLPFVIHALWDYVAARRLKSAIDAIAARGEPVTLRDIERYDVLSSEAAQAARYYLAAADLAYEGGAQNTPILRARTQRVQDAIAGGSLPADALIELRAIVDDYEQPLELLDHATPLIFEDFAPGTESSYRWSQLQHLLAIAGLRTVLETQEGTGARALESFYAEVRLLRPLERASSIPVLEPVRHIVPLAARLAMTLEHNRPSGPTLEQVANALDRLDRDDRLKDSLRYERARTIEIAMFRALGVRYGGIVTPLGPGPRPPGLSDALRRPWVAGLLRERLDTFDAQIAAAGQPWPSRIDAVEQVPLRPARAPAWLAPAVPRLFAYAEESMARGLARDTALLRCARVTIAIERYRADRRGEPPPRLSDLVPQYLRALPIDPFSGAPLRYALRPSEYAVYSVGTNRIDDGGRFDGTELRGRDTSKRLQAAADFGMRITIRQ